MVDHAPAPAPRRQIVIQDVKVRNFGRIKSLDLDLGPGINIVIGQNDSGKTMLLHLLASVSRRRRLPDRLQGVCEESFTTEMTIGDGPSRQKVVAAFTSKPGSGSRPTLRYRATPEIRAGSTLQYMSKDRSPLIVNLESPAVPSSPLMPEALQLLAELNPTGRWAPPLEADWRSSFSRAQVELVRLACEAVVRQRAPMSTPVIIDGLAGALDMSKVQLYMDLVLRLSQHAQVILAGSILPSSEWEQYVIAHLGMYWGTSGRTGPGASSMSGVSPIRQLVPASVQPPHGNLTPESPPMSSDVFKPSVFISYSSADAIWRNKLATQLGVLKRTGLLETWDDQRIGAGTEWRAEILKAVNAASVAVLLITADYLTSDFIQETEVPRLLERRQKGGLRIVPVLIRSCDWRAIDWLRNMRVLPRHDRFIASGTEHEVDDELAGVARELRELLSDPALPRASSSSPSMGELVPRFLNDETRRLSEQLEAARARKLALKSRNFSTVEVEGEVLDLRRRIREGGQLRAGDALGEGRYLLLERVGRGGFAVVWKAHDRVRDELVAIKVLHTDVAGDPTRRERFFRGARVMADLQHEAVVRVLEPHGEDGGYHYFVMELIDGPTLQDAVRRGQLAPEDVLPLILCIGGALAAAHAKGIVHRDVKPANILLDASKNPKLTDFDLVQAADTTGGTRTGALGTFVYAAPEIMERPQEADARADVYSLGMTALFALHGAELPMMVLQQPRRILEGLPVGRRVKDVLWSAIQWERDRRFADIGVFCTNVKSAIDGTNEAMPMVTTKQLPPFGTAESDVLEFKLTYGTGSDRFDRRDIARDVAAFANAQGGRIIVGARLTSMGVLEAYVPLSGVDATETVQAIEGATRDWCAPAPTIDVFCVAVGDGSIVVVDVHPERSLPVLVMRRDAPATTAEAFLRRGGQTKLVSRGALYDERKSRRGTQRFEAVHEVEHAVVQWLTSTRSLQLNRAEHGSGSDYWYEHSGKRTWVDIFYSATAKIA